MFNKEEVNKVNSYLKKHFNIVSNFEFRGLMLLYGDSIIKLLMNKKLEILNFVLLTHDKENIRDFLKVNKIHYEFNSEKMCYSFYYNNHLINIYFTNDLHYVGNLNTDHIFFDIKRKYFIPLGIKYALKYNEVFVLYYDKNCSKNKIDQAKDFIRFMNHNKKNVKVRYGYNRLKELFTLSSKKTHSTNTNYDNLLNDKLKEKIQKYIHEKFDIIFDYPFEGRVFLYGGAIRSLILDKKVNDLDFVILTQDNCQVGDFIRQYKLDYSTNIFGGPKIKYNDTEIDIFSVNDLTEASGYNIDTLFYDIHSNKFLTCGVFDALKTRKIFLLKNVKNDEKIVFDRKLRKKLTWFIKSVTKSEKRVKIKTNKFIDFYKFNQLIVKKISRVIIKTLKKNDFIKCFQFIKDCKKEFIITLIIGLIISIISIVSPALSARIIESILNLNYHSVVVLICILMLAKILGLVLHFFFSKLYLILKKKMVFNIRKYIINCVINFEMNNFTNNNSGFFIDKLKNDPNEITRLFNDIKSIITKGIGNMGALIYIYYLDFRIGLIFTFFMFVIIYIKMIGIKKRISARKEYYINQEKYSSILGEMLNCFGDIRSLNLKNSYMQRTMESFDTIGEKEYIGQQHQNKYDKLAKLVEYIAIGFIMLVGLFLVEYNYLDVSNLIVIYMYHSTIFMFLDKIGTIATLYTDLNLACNRIFSLTENKIYNSELYGNIYRKKCNGKIEFSNVKFKYDNNSDLVLNGCSFIVNPGETLAIVGKSGSGKTTMLNLITRLYNITDGKIKIDDTEIEEYNEEFIRQNISIISQNPYLFDVSIKENFRLVDDRISDDRIKKICKEVCMDEFIESLPHKYDTIIGEGGVKLSGGQKQRLGIARALVRNSKIILLDEITSALDNETGHAIKQVIDNIKGKHTIIIVTHELSMIKDCSNILVLDNGKIIGSGTHRTLLKNNSIYKNLYKMR